MPTASQILGQASVRWSLCSVAVVSVVVALFLHSDALRDEPEDDENADDSGSLRSNHKKEKKRHKADSQKQSQQLLLHQQTSQLPSHHLPPQEQSGTQQQSQQPPAQEPQPLAQLDVQQQQLKGLHSVPLAEKPAQGSIAEDVKTSNMSKMAPVMPMPAPVVQSRMSPWATSSGEDLRNLNLCRREAPAMSFKTKRNFDLMFQHESRSAGHGLGTGSRSRARNRQTQADERPSEDRAAADAPSEAELRRIQAELLRLDARCTAARHQPRAKKAAKKRPQRRRANNSIVKREDSQRVVAEAELVNPMETGDGEEQKQEDAYEANVAGEEEYDVELAQEDEETEETAADDEQEVAEEEAPEQREEAEEKEDEAVVENEAWDEEQEEQEEVEEEEEEVEQEEEEQEQDEEEQEQEDALDLSSADAERRRDPPQVLHPEVREAACHAHPEVCDAAVQTVDSGLLPYALPEVAVAEVPRQAESRPPRKAGADRLHGGLRHTPESQQQRVRNFAWADLADSDEEITPQALEGGEKPKTDIGKSHAKSNGIKAQQRSEQPNLKAAN